MTPLTQQLQVASQELLPVETDPPGPRHSVVYVTLPDETVKFEVRHALTFGAATAKSSFELQAGSRGTPRPKISQHKYIQDCLTLIEAAIP